LAILGLPDDSFRFGNYVIAFFLLLNQVEVVMASGFVALSDFADDPYGFGYVEGEYSSYEFQKFV